MTENSIEKCVVKLKCGEEIGNALIIDDSRAITVRHCIREHLENGKCISLFFKGDGDAALDAELIDHEQLASEQIVVLSFSPQIDISVFPLFSYVPEVFEKAATFGFNKNYSDRAIWHELTCIRNNVDPQSGIIQDLVFREESSEKTLAGLSGSPIVKYDNRNSVYGLVSTERLEYGQKIDIGGISLSSHSDYLKRESISVIGLQELASTQGSDTESVSKWNAYLNDENPLKPYMYNAEVIGFCGRQNEMTDLMKFIESDQAFSWWVLSGEAGSGKSRLAYELSKKLSKTGWSVSYLFSEDANKLEEIHKSFDKNKKSLIIADNGRTYSYMLGKWMLEVINCTFEKIRVLIIDRNTIIDQDDILLRSLCEGDLNGQLLNLIWNREHLRLNKFEDDEVRSIISSYAIYRKLLIDKDIVEDILRILHVIDDDHMRPLYVMFIVDAWSEGFNLTNCRLENILEWINKREYSHRANIIRECVGDTRVNVRRVKSIDTLLFISTINGGIDLDVIKEKYREYWQDAVTKIEDSVTGVEMEEVLVSTGLLEDSTIIPVKPDILGEYFVISNFDKMKSAMFADDWADNENLQAFLFRVLFDFKEKTINYKPFRIPFLHEFMKGKPRTQNAIDIYSHTLQELIYYERLDNNAAFVDKLAEIYGYNDSIQCAINYSVGLVVLSAKQTEMASLVKTVETLRVLEEKYSDDEIRVHYAMALFNLSNSQDIQEKYVTIRRIRLLLKKDNENQLVAYEYAKSLYNLFGYQPVDAEMKTAEELKHLSEAYPENEDIAIEYAMFLYNIHDEGLSEQQIDSMIDQLYKLSLRFTNNTDIQFYVVWTLRFISYKQDDLKANHTEEIIDNILSGLKREDTEMIEARGAIKFFRDEDGEQMFKVINMGGKLYFDEDICEDSCDLISE